MKFSQNHLLHFIIILIIVTMCAVGIGFQQMNINQIGRDTNRLASARLIIHAIDSYKDQFQKYPLSLDDLKAFLSPVPVDTETGKPFSYTLTSDGYTLIIPQETSKPITLSKK